MPERSKSRKMVRTFSAMVNELVTTASPNIPAINDSRGMATRRLKIVPIITIRAAPAMRPVVARSRVAGPAGGAAGVRSAAGSRSAALDTVCVLRRTPVRTQNGADDLRRAPPRHQRHRHDRAAIGAYCRSLGQGYLPRLL